MAWMDSFFLAGYNYSLHPSVLLPSVSMLVEPLRSGTSARSGISSRCSAPIWPAFLARSPVGPGSASSSPRTTTVARTASCDFVDLHFRAGLEPVLSIDHNLISFSDAAGDQRDVALRHVHFHRLQVRKAIFDGVHIRALRSSLNGRERNDNGILANR